MFTGIIKELGKVRAISGLGNMYKLSIEAGRIAPEADIGDSMAVNGVCLTLTAKSKTVLDFDVMAQTIRTTTLGRLRIGDAVNLEDALRAGNPIGGHFVSGHIDCIGRVRDIKKSSNEVSMEISFPEEYSNLVVEKGSVALDGISLTIGKVSRNNITVYLIPHTLGVTTFGGRRIGDDINIEFDMIGKYIARLAKHTDS